MLPKQSIGELRASKRVHVFPATVAYFEGPVDDRSLADLTGSLSGLPVPKGMTWLLYGYGSSPRVRYAQLARTPGVEVIWSAPIMPWWLYPISFIAAAQGGLLRLQDASTLAGATQTLANLAMVEAYLAPEALVSGVVAHVRHRRWLSNIGRVVGEDERYFCLGVDGDPVGVHHGKLAWVSYGGACPPAVMAMLDPFLGSPESSDHGRDVT